MIKQTEGGKFTSNVKKMQFISVNTSPEVTGLWKSDFEGQKPSRIQKLILDL